MARRLTADVVVIGGGSTGAGVVRDAAMRGFSAVLVDRSDQGQGTPGRFHGLLHSGGRYVVSDPGSASECASENAILSRIQAPAIERTGGLFVAVPGDDPDYGDRFLAGARATGVPAREISVRVALRREPRLNPGIVRAIEVEDASVDGWQLVWGAVNSAKAYGPRCSRTTRSRTSKSPTEPLVALPRSAPRRGRPHRVPVRPELRRTAGRSS